QKECLVAESNRRSSHVTSTSETLYHLANKACYWLEALGATTHYIACRFTRKPHSLCFPLVNDGLSRLVDCFLSQVLGPRALMHSKSQMPMQIILTTPRSQNMARCVALWKTGSAQSYIHRERAPMSSLVPNFQSLSLRGAFTRASGDGRVLPIRSGVRRGGAESSSVDPNRRFDVVTRGPCRALHQWNATCDRTSKTPRLLEQREGA
ncbi:hypothetical protein BDP55DRAFT_644186, partial [Colletotrichum godetiae]